MTTIHAVVPDSIDDPTRPSGGNTYDRRVCQGLAGLGWLVHEHPVSGSWPAPDASARVGLTDVLASVPDGAVVLLDGLIASAVPQVVVPASERLSVVVLVHMPLGDGAPATDPDGTRDQEGAVLAAAAAVVTTSRWARQRLLDLYALPAERIRVAEPGVDAAAPAPGTAAGGELLCVAAVTPAKGHDALVAALATLPDRSWRCVCVGSLARDPAFVDDLVHRGRDTGIGPRLSLPGPLTGADLDAAYAGADLLVLASRAETYGMVVTEALARGLPVVATAVGGVAEALGHAPDGSRPGLLVPPGDQAALAAALRDWLDDEALRQHLRRAATRRRATLADWTVTTGRVARVLAAVAG